MSAPENSNSKTPPSLLSDTKPAGEGGPRQSRILADLEGRVTPPAEPPRRSLKAPIAAVVALVVAVGGWGAWRMQQSSGEQPAVVTAATAPAAAAPDKATPASGAAAQVAQNGASAASAVQPATIVNDDSASQ
ncbi:phage tail protein, partial [Burkholderia cenocepacia]|nr:phage tail protein [Burkholderia cenocepacia]